jgi:hypothetical protein
MKATPSPIRPGDPCWSVDYVESKLSPVAQVGSESIDWFLATHSPITCQDSRGPVSELALFNELFAAKKNETLVVVKGEPGAGKSQLINWLKLKFDDAIAGDAKPEDVSTSLKTVLIRRRSGSLKDALQQLVDQLPDYRHFLSDIQSAIAQVSGDEAARRLYHEMYQCLYAARDSIPSRLKFLFQVFNDNGTVDWLCRPGGAIDRNIRRLTSESDANARESLPPFAAEDFCFPLTAYTAFNQQLKDRLEDDPAIQEAAAAAANEHLRAAIATMTGLRGQTLHEVFRNIRSSMRQRGEMLALFIEDVSTLSVLDEELVNALEPQNDPSLCKLISVLGMTKPSFDRLPDNIIGRVDRVLELSGSSSIDVAEGHTDASDRFVARYLNALRAGLDGAVTLAAEVRRHGDPDHSVCTNCALRSDCFKAFGSVTVGDAEIGLYPLAPGAAHRLLMGLNTGTNLKTPRTLLQHVVRDLLGSAASGFIDNGSTVGLAIIPISPTDLAQEQDRMLQGWSEAQKNRLSYLMHYWTGEQTLIASAARLAPMLPWFHHPPFSSRVVPTEPAPTREQPRTGQPSHTKTPKPVEPVAPPAYVSAMSRLDAWGQQEQALRSDADFRDLLVKAIRGSLPVEECRSPSQRVRNKTGLIGTANIEIEGMVAKPIVGATGKAKFQFPRNGETYELLKDLLAFTHLGRSSWEYAGGASARRRYGHWLTVRQASLVQAYNVETTDRNIALGIAVRFLQLAYRFCERKALPSDTGSAIELLTTFEPVAVRALSDEMQKLAGDLPKRVDDLRKELLDELAVPQGGGSVNYIDPRPIIEHLSWERDDLSLRSLPGDRAANDYPAIKRLESSGWPQLSQALAAEQAALVVLVDAIRPIFSYWNVSADSLHEGLGEYLRDAREVVKACIDTQQSLGNPVLQSRIEGFTPSVVLQYCNVLKEAEAVLEQEPTAILSLHVKEVSDLLSLVESINQVLRRLRDALASKLEDVITQEDVELERAGVQRSLEELATFGAVRSPLMESDEDVTHDE